MIARIVRHDWAALRADALVWLIAAITIVSVGLGLWNGTRWVRFQQDALALVSTEERERYATLTTEIAAQARSGARVSPFADPGNPSTFAGRRGVRSAGLPPAPLGAFSIGQSDLLPSSLQVSMERRDVAAATSEIENPSRLLVGRFDLAFVVIYLYPLLILGLTYNLLSGEREDGTLALVLSQPVTVGTLVAAKVTVRMALLFALIVGTALLATAVGVLTQGAGPGLVVRAALWTLAVGAYGAVWFALAVAVISLGRASASNATLLASAWLLLVVLVPALLNVLVNALYPVPSRVQLVQAVREASDAANTRGSALLARYFEEHPELAGGDVAAAANDMAAIRLAVSEAVAHDVRPVLQTYERQRQRQERLVEQARVLSPALLMQDALNDIAGTGTARYRHFLAEVDRFQAAWRAHFSPLIVSRGRVSTLDAVPTFSYRDEEESAVVRRVGQAVIGLLIPAALLGWLGLRRLSQYPVLGS